MRAPDAELLGEVKPGGAANASGNAAKRERPLESFIFILFRNGPITLE